MDKNEDASQSPHTNSAKTLHTFQSDLAGVIERKQGSVIKIAMAEEEKRHKEEQNKDPASKKNIALLTGSLIALALALGIAGYFLIIKAPKTVPIEKTVSYIPTLLAVDNVKGFDITGLSKDQLNNLISKEYAGSNPKINTVSQFYFTTLAVSSPSEEGGDAKISIPTPELVSTEKFWTVLDSHMGGELLRSFDPTFTLGLHAWNRNGLFILMKTNSYPNALAGMLKWEAALFDDLYPMFGIGITGENASLFRATWKDRVIKNQDTRVLTDTSGNIVLYYGFLGEDKSMLLIADKEQTLEEVVNRMNAPSLRK